MGVIDAKYDVAISTACGQLDFIVVETTEVGQECIEYLRENGLGRASFIVLDKMRPVASSEDIPKGATRLFDLIKPKHVKFAPAFYFAVGNTLVAASMQEATRLAYQESKRHRVVTVDGRIIDSTGTISGGGSTVNRGGMKATLHVDVTPQQMSQLRTALSHKQNELRELLDKMEKLKSAIRARKTDLAAVEAQFSRVELALGSLPQQLQDLCARKDQLRQSSKPPSKADTEKLKRLSEEVIQQESKLFNLQQSCEPVRIQIAEVQNQIMEAGGMKFKTQKQKVAGLREQITLTRNRAVKLEAQRDALRGKTTNGSTGEGMSTVERDLEMLSQEIKAIEAEMQYVTEQALALTKEHQNILKVLGFNSLFYSIDCRISKGRT